MMEGKANPSIKLMKRISKFKQHAIRNDFLMRADHFIDVQAEYKRTRQEQHDAEWEDRHEDAVFYKEQADHYERLLKEGVIYEPKF